MIFLFFSEILDVPDLSIFHDPKFVYQLGFVHKSGVHKSEDALYCFFMMLRSIRIRSFSLIIAIEVL